MQINQLLEEKLWNVSPENPFDKKTCDEVINYLLGRLGQYLQQPLELVGDNWMCDSGFSASFRGAIKPRDAFHITYVGPLGMDYIDKEYGAHYSASLFLFGDHHRLSAGAPNRSYIEVVYEKGEGNVGQWRSLGWEIDEFDEFEDIVENEYGYKQLAASEDVLR